MYPYSEHVVPALLLLALLLINTGCCHGYISKVLVRAPVAPRNVGKTITITTDHIEIWAGQERRGCWRALVLFSNSF
jgi:hypothetical protein